MFKWHNQVQVTEVFLRPRDSCGTLASIINDRFGLLNNKNKI